MDYIAILHSSIKLGLVWRSFRIILSKLACQEEKDQDEAAASNRVAVKELESNYYNKETALCTRYPYYGNFI